MDEQLNLTIETVALLEAIERTRHAMAKGMTHPVLAALRFARDGEGSATVTGSDGYMLCEQTVKATGDMGAFLLAREDVEALRRMLQDIPKSQRSVISCVFRMTANRVVNAQTTALTSPILTFMVVDAQYPSYLQLIPDNADASPIDRIGVRGGKSGALARALAGLDGEKVVRLWFFGSREKPIKLTTNDGFRAIVMPSFCSWERS